MMIGKGTNSSECLLTLSVPQVGSEKGLSQAAGGVGEPRLLRVRPDLVAAVKGKADEARDDRVLDELGGHAGGRLDALGVDAEASDGDLVGVDIAAGAAAVAVADGPAGARHLLGGGRLGGRVDGVAGGRRLGRLGAKDPQVGGAGVKVQGEDLSRSADGDGGDVLRIGAVTGVVGRRAGLALGESLLGLPGSHERLQVVADGSAILSLGLEESSRAVGDVVLVVLDLDGSRLLTLGGEGRGQAAGGEEGNEKSSKGLHLEYRRRLLTGWLDLS